MLLLDDAFQRRAYFLGLMGAITPSKTTSPSVNVVIQHHTLSFSFCDSVDASRASRPWRAGASFGGVVLPPWLGLMDVIKPG